MERVTGIGPAFSAWEGGRAAAGERRRTRANGGGRGMLYGILMTLLVIVLVSGCGFGLLLFNLLRSGPARS